MLIRRHPNHLQHHIRPRRPNTLNSRSGRHKYAKLPTENRKRHATTHFESMKLIVALLRVHSVEVRHQQNQQEGEGSGPDAPPAMVLDTYCLLPRPPRCGRRCSRTKTSGRRSKSRPMLNVVCRRSYALRCLRHCCGQLPRLLDQSCPLGGALSHTLPDAPPPPPPSLSPPGWLWWSLPPPFLPPTPRL